MSTKIERFKDIHDKMTVKQLAMKINELVEAYSHMLKFFSSKPSDNPSLTHNKPVEKLGSVHIKLPAGTYEIVNDKPAETEPVLCPSTHGTDYTIPTPDSSLDELYEVILQWDCLRKSDLVVPKEDIKDLAKAVREHIKSKIDEVGWCGVGDLDNISREDVLKALGID